MAHHSTWRWVMLLLAIIVAGVLRYTKFGRHCLRSAPTSRPARLCGVKIDWTKIRIYSIAGLIVGVASVMQFSAAFQGDATTRGGAGTGRDRGGGDRRRESVGR